MAGWENRTGEAWDDANIVPRRHGACLTIGNHSHEHRLPLDSGRRPDVAQAPTKPATPSRSGCGNTFAPRAPSSRPGRTCTRGTCAERNASTHWRHMVRFRPPAGRIPGAKRRTGSRRRSQRARGSPRSADRAAVVSGSAEERRRRRDRRGGRIAPRPSGSLTVSSSNATLCHGNRVRPTTWRQVRFGGMKPPTVLQIIALIRKVAGGARPQPTKLVQGWGAKGALRMERVARAVG